MNQPSPTHPSDTKTAPQMPKLNMNKPSKPARLLLLVLGIVGAAVSGICPELISASFFASVAAGFLVYSFLISFSPAVLFSPLISAAAAFVLTSSPYHALQALLCLPLTIAIIRCLILTKNKTTTVIRAALALGISVTVLFLITYMMAHGTIAPAALRQSYNDFFASMQEQMTESMLNAYNAVESAAQTTAETSDLSHPIIDGAAGTAVDSITQDTTSAEKLRAANEAYIRSLVELSVNSVKLAFPALVAVAAQIFAYMSLSVYRRLAIVCQTKQMLPRPFRITVSRTAAVIFVIAYLINMFPSGDSISVMQIASANLATMMMPGIFIMGLTSLQRRAKNPFRRRSFIITAVVLGILVFLSPAYAVFFVLIDGIGEIFFGGRSIF